ncbi:MAG: hypothetical protein PGN25_11865 [Methylorubrum populi]
MPTTRRDRTGRAPRILRALTAVAALYALALQALLGGIAALPVAGAPGFLCASIRNGDAAISTAKDGLPAPDLPHPGCCTAANHAPAAALPSPASTGIAWTARDAVRADWRGTIRRAARPPPFTLAHARAPPAA